tara:strand:+ start:7211 stop:11086 length:3876 start_codon:yes stop_codon:yes gene_type:complete
MSEFGWAYVGGEIVRQTGGPSGSVQLKGSTDTELTGSQSFVFDASTNTLNITGTVNVSGTLNANEFNLNVVNKSVSNITVSGSTNFGDTTDDLHRLTGSFIVSGAANTLISADASTGRIGIGLTGSEVPSKLLHVYGDVKIEGTLHGGSPLQIAGGVTLQDGALNALNSSISAIAFTGSGGALTDLPVQTYTNAVNNRLLTSAGSGSVNAETNLTFDGSVLNVSGSKQTLNVDTSTGRVAINTGSANYELEVAGDIGLGATLFHNGDEDTKFVYQDNRITLHAGGVSSIDIRGDLTPKRIDIGDYDFKISGSDGTTLYSDYSERKIGIKTESPTHDLSVSGTMAVSGSTVFENQVAMSGNLNLYSTLSSSSPITASFFIGDGSKITGVTGEWDGSHNGDGAITGSLVVSSSTGLMIDADASTGRVGIGTSSPQKLLHVAGETRLDGILYGGTTLELGTNTNVTGAFSASLNISASGFFGSGTGLTSLPVQTYNNASNNRILTSVDADTIQGEANLTFDGSILNVSGTEQTLNVNTSTGRVAINTGSSNYELEVNGDIGLGASLFHNGDEDTKYVYQDNRITLFAGGSSAIDIRGDTSPKRITFGAFDLQVTGSTSMSGNVSLQNNLTASGHVSASNFYGNFYGDGTNITGVTAEWDGSHTGSAGISGSLSISGSTNPLSLFGLQAGTATTSSYLAVAADGTIVTTSSVGTDEIGAAEDGSYADGLFTDFTNNTKIGTAIDRFNEILKALAPSPAPSLDDISCTDTGQSGKLSFGSSLAIGGYTNVSTAAGFSAVDANGTYSTSTSNNNLRKGLFNGSTIINGVLNADVVSNGSNPNHPADSFGDADQGALRLEVNGTIIHTASLTDAAVGSGSPGSGGGTSLNSSGSGFFNLSQTASAHFDDGTELDVFQHRTGEWKVHPDDQRNGWNYARILHTISGVDTTTNYVEWVNDPDSNALAESNASFTGLSMTGLLYISGVKYFTGGTATYNVDVANAYKNTYSTSNVTFTTVKCSISAQAMPSIGGGENSSKNLPITGAATITSDNIFNGSISARAVVSHPLKSNLSTSNLSISNILLYNIGSTSTVVSETFRRENYRMVSGSYANQSNVTDSDNSWNSSGSLDSNDGLMVYNFALRSPSQGANSGNFSTISNGPGSNVNYSGITSGTRTYYRKFQNNSGGSKTNFDLTIQGSGTIVSQGTSLNSSRIHVLVKLPTTSNSQETGWMDLATAFSTGQTGDGDGCLVGSLDSSLNATNEVTFGTEFASANDYIMVKIEADASWTGNISAMSVSWS